MSLSPCRLALRPTPSVPLAMALLSLWLLVGLGPGRAQADDNLALRLAPALARGPTTPLNAPPTAPAASPAWPELLRDAAEHAAASRAADAGAVAAQALSDQARATAWMPRVDATAAGNRTQQTINGLSVRTPTTSVSLSATMPLWRAADRAAARAQSAQADQAVWRARQTRADVALTVSRAYLTAVEAAEQRRLVLAQQALLEEQLRINERRLQAGVGTVLEVLETRTRVDQARATVQELATRLATQRLTLEQLTGRTLGVLPAGLAPGSAALPEVVPTLEDALTLMPQRNPAWQDTQAQIRSAQATAQARDAERWQPTVDAVASWGRSKQVEQFSGLSDEQTVSARSIGVQMNWPLYTGGLQAGRTREAAALLAQAEARRDEALADVISRLRDAYQVLAQSQALAAVQQQVEASASATFDAVRKAFVAGMRTNQDLLDAQQQIYVARQNLVGARINALLAQVDILALLDLLDGAHIAPLTSLMDPAS